jgi:hypothetical protein
MLTITYHCDWCSKSADGAMSLLGPLLPDGWQLVCAPGKDRQVCSDSCRDSDARYRSEVHGNPKDYIYVVQRGIGGPIKVGFSRTPTRRISELQRQSPEPLVLREIYLGDRRCEASIHQELAPYRMNGEWFQPSASALVHEAYWGSPWGRAQTDAQVAWALKNPPPRNASGDGE